MAMRKSDFEAALKIHYFGAFKDALDNSTALLSRMERYTEETGGKHLHIPFRNSRTTSVGARGDTTLDASLPTGASPGYTQCTFAVKPQYATIRISGFSMRTSRRPDYAYARAQVKDMEDTAKDFKKDIQRQLFGDGSAILATISSTASSTSFTVAHPIYPTKPNKFFFSGMKVDIRVVTTHALGSTGCDSATVNSVSGTNTVLFNSAVSTAGTANTFAIYREDNINTDGSSIYNINEFVGLAGAIDDSDPDSAYTYASGVPKTANFGALDRASEVTYQANVLSNSGTLRPFSIALVEEGIDKGEEEVGAECSFIQTNYKIHRIYGAYLAAAKQVEMMKMELDGGWKALGVNGIPMVRDVDSPDYTIFCIDENDWYLGVTDDWNWLTGDNGEILSRLDGEDMYEAVMNRDMVLMGDRPKGSTKILDISHS